MPTGTDWGEQVTQHSNLVVLRTLSKAFALAGARVGYAMGHPSLIDRIDAMRPPGSIASISMVLAEAALRHPDLATRAVETLANAREVLATELGGLGFRVLPSDVNFLLCEVGTQAGVIAARLRARGLVVRTFPEESGLEEYLRFTVRSREQNERLITTLREELL